MIRISFGGDFRALYPEKITLSKELQSFLFSNAINAINFEAPIKTDFSTISKSGPSLYQSEQSPFCLENWGINLVSLANNHMMDYGVKALYETINRFQKAKTIGAGNWEQAYNMEVFSIHGKRVGFMGLTQYEFGTLTDNWDEKNSVGCAWINHECVDNLIIEYKHKVDALIVFAHAGVEYLNIPLPEWRDRYRQLIAKGADAVIASHPHVPQAWEEYLGKPIFYSLGNFCFQKDVKFHKPHWNNSLCVLLTFDEDMKLSYTMRNIKYDSYKIDFFQDEEIVKYINDCLYYLSDNSLYMSRVNKAVIELLPMYYNLFNIGINSVRCDRRVENFVRFVKRNILNKEEPVHLINNLRCESHRWSIQRAMKVLYELS